MLSRWLRWLVVAPVVLFVFGAILLSCTGGSSGGGPVITPAPGFSLESIVIANGPPPTATFTPTVTATPTASTSGTPRKTPKPTPTKVPTVTTSPTLTPRATALPTTIAPGSVPTGGTVAFNAIGTFVKNKQNKTKLVDITFGQFTLWTSTDNNVFQAPLSGPMGGVYTTGFAGCVCILASSGGVSSQSVAVGVYVDVDTCPICEPVPPTPTSTPTPAAGERAAASSTPAASVRSAGVLMWTFDAGSELRGRIATGTDGSIFFITRDGVLHGLNSAGKEILHRDAAGS
jgi:hypothetical protein